VRRMRAAMWCKLRLVSSSAPRWSSSAAWPSTPSTDPCARVTSRTAAPALASTAGLMGGVAAVAVDGGQQDALDIAVPDPLTDTLQSFDEGRRERVRQARLLD